MKRTVLLLTIILLTAFTGQVLAVGSGAFENASFSAKSLAQSNAVVARAEEPATMSTNPSGIVDLPGIQFQSNTALINLFTHFSGGQGNTQSSATTSVIPTAYLSINPGKYLNDRIAFGVAMDSPFGLANKYDANHPAVRYTSHVNWLKMFTVKPTVSIKLTDWLLVGGGPVYNRIFDMGGVQQYPNALLGGAFPDGQVRAKLSGNSWGWQLGTLIKPHKKHHFGFYFRSPSHITTRGRIQVENATIGGNFETGAHAKLVLPMNMTMGYAFHPSEKTSLEADFGYTRWSSFNRFYINADPVNAADDAILSAIGQGSGNDKDWKNSFSIHLGGKHKVSEKLTLMGGGFFFSNAIPNDHFIPRVPDSNSLALTLGMSYEVIKNLEFDAAYMGRFWLTREIDNTISNGTAATPLAGNVDGKYFTYGQEFMFSFTYRWETAFGHNEQISRAELKPSPIIHRNLS